MPRWGTDEPPSPKPKSPESSARQSKRARPRSKSRSATMSSWFASRRRKPKRQLKISSCESAPACHPATRPDRAPDTPLRLAVAAAIAYPDGSMTAAGLRRERDRGRLIVERTAGKDYTTLTEINRMRELCRVNPRELSRPGAPAPGSPADIERANAALRRTLDDLRKKPTQSTGKKPRGRGASRRSD